MWLLGKSGFHQTRSQMKEGAMVESDQSDMGKGQHCVKSLQTAKNALKSIAATICICISHIWKEQAVPHLLIANWNPHL